MRDRKYSDACVVCLHNILVIGDLTETHTQTHTGPTVVLLLETLYNFDGFFAGFLRGRYEWSAQAAQDGTNNPFITITPQGAMVKLHLILMQFSEEQTRREIQRDGRKRAESSFTARTNSKVNGCWLDRMSSVTIVIIDALFICLFWSTNGNYPLVTASKLGRVCCILCPMTGNWMCFGFELVSGS